jgi:hypothetical protein
VPLDRTDPAWLEHLLDAALAGFDPDAARARLPDGVAGASPGAGQEAAARLLVARSLRQRRLVPAGDPASAFEACVRGHVALALDLALLVPGPFSTDGARALGAAVLAAAAGDAARAVAIAPGAPSPRAVARALRAAAVALAERFDPPADPRGGLPLYPGKVAIFRRHAAGAALAALAEGRLAPEALARLQADADLASTLLVEALAAQSAATGAAPEVRLTWHRQTAALGLPRPAAREARRAAAAPRPASALARAAPPALRAFLFEQLLLAQLRTRLPAGPAAAFEEAFALSAGLEPAEIAEAQVEAAAQHGDQAVWAEAIGGRPAGRDWQALAEAWEQTADAMVERVSTAVTGNLEAIVTEIRETGELGQLLARAAAGTPLTAAEREKVKEQLLDLAKAVPALALFAAPGGAILLPVLAKLLPFSVLPSAWEKGRAARLALAPGEAPPAPRAGAAGVRDG